MGFDIDAIAKSNSLPLLDRDHFGEKRSLRLPLFLIVLQPRWLPSIAGNHADPEWMQGEWRHASAELPPP
jgi:hypothetical protein